MFGMETSLLTEFSVQEAINKDRDLMDCLIEMVAIFFSFLTVYLLLFIG